MTVTHQHSKPPECHRAPALRSTCQVQLLRAVSNSGVVHCFWWSTSHQQSAIAIAITPQALACNTIHFNKMDDSLLRASVSTIEAYQDENCNTSSFSSMTQAFSQRIAELQQLVCFRVEGVYE